MIGYKLDVTLEYADERGWSHQPSVGRPEKPNGRENVINRVHVREKP